MKHPFAFSLSVVLFLSLPLSTGAVTNLNSSKSNIYRAACQGKPDGARVKVEGQNMTYQAGIAVSDPGAPGDKAGSKKNK